MCLLYYLAKRFKDTELGEAGLCRSVTLEKDLEFPMKQTKETLILYSYNASIFMQLTLN